MGQIAAVDSGHSDDGSVAVEILGMFSPCLHQRGSGAVVIPSGRLAERFSRAPAISVKNSTLELVSSGRREGPSVYRGKC